MQGSAAMKCNEGNLHSAFQGVAFGRALATFVRQRAQLLFRGLAVCDSGSHRRTMGDSRWPWKEQPRPGGHAGSRMAPGRSSRCPRSRPSGRAARTHSPARSCSSVAWLSAIAGLIDALTVTAVAAEGAAAPPGGHAPRLDRHLKGISFVAKVQPFRAK